MWESKVPPQEGKGGHILNYASGIKLITKYNPKSIFFYFAFFLGLETDFFFFFFFGSGGIYCLSFSFSHNQTVIQYNKKKGYITILSTNECRTSHSIHNQTNHNQNHNRE